MEEREQKRNGETEREGEGGRLGSRKEGKKEGNIYVHPLNDGFHRINQSFQSLYLKG